MTCASKSVYLAHMALTILVLLIVTVAFGHLIYFDSNKEFYDLQCIQLVLLFTQFFLSACVLGVVVSRKKTLLYIYAAIMLVLFIGYCWMSYVSCQSASNGICMLQRGNRVIGTMEISTYSLELGDKTVFLLFNAFLCGLAALMTEKQAKRNSYDVEMEPIGDRDTVSDCRNQRDWNA